MNTLPRWWSGALQLSGGSCINCGTPSQLNFTGQSSFTIEGWVYPTAFNAPQSVFTRLIPPGVGYGLWLQVDGTIVGQRMLDSVKSSTPLTVNTWHHVAVTYDGQNLTVYLDGVQAAQAPSASVIPDLSTVGAFVGNSGFNAFFQGMISDVEVYNVARTAAQIFEDTVIWDGPDDATLVAYYDFSGLPCAERSGNALPMAFQGPPYMVACVPGLILNGTGYVDCGNSPDLSLGGNVPYTIEGWFSGQTQPPDGVLISKFQESVQAEYAVWVAPPPLQSYRNVGPWAATAPGQMVSNEYYHFATTYDGSILRVYINGNLQSAQTIGGQPSFPNLHTLIGAYYDVNGNIKRNFNGQIQNIRMWKVALSQADIRQWIYNDPVADPDLIANFDFTTNPPTDTTGNHTLTLQGGAQTGFVTIPIDPSSALGQVGCLMPQVHEDLAPEGSTVIPTQTCAYVAPQPLPFSTEHLDLLRKDLAGWVEGPHSRGLTHEQMEHAFAEAATLYHANPKLNSVTSRVENGFVILTHHTSRGDVEIFRAPEGSIDPCTLWWMQFVYLLTVGFYQAIGLAPSTGNIAGRIYEKISGNPVTMQAIATLLKNPITVTSAIGVMGVIWKQGLMWSLLKLIFTSAGWWTLAWLLTQVIKVLTGLEAAAILAGFTVWAAQLVVLATSCPCNKALLDLPETPHPELAGAALAG